MPRKHAAISAETRVRGDQAVRRKRFAKQFERWCRGEPVRSYDTKWLAYLKEHQFELRTSSFQVQLKVLTGLSRTPAFLFAAESGVNATAAWSTNVVPPGALRILPSGCSRCG